MDIPALYKKFLASGKISTDTRQIAPGSVFFALKGPNFNANEFAAEALEKGALFAVVEAPEFCKNDRVLLAEDSLLALQQLARHHRDQLRIPVIGLTGSNGKTTTKEMLHAVLSKRFVTSSTKGNLNNHIGVPLTILEIETTTEIAVVEMGANHVGEIASLCEIVNPTHGLITNIGRAHIGTFGGEGNILRAKTELYQYLLNHSGTVFINSKNPLLSNMAKRFAAPVFYPALGDYYHCELIDADPYVKIRMEDGHEITTHFTGTYNFENIAAALCVGKFFDVGSHDSRAAIESYVPGNMRSQMVFKGSNRIILDAYNANPSSMEAAINNLAEMKSARKVAVLGDMYELGEETETEHKKLGSVLSKAGIREVYLCGVLIKAMLETYPAAAWFSTQEELMNFLTINPVEDATILIKASRGMRMERVVDAL
jgi:UDP-N-acetylmuramoyl-tripeptide--D-alanyl-D-alanine ligase